MIDGSAVSSLQSLRVLSSENSEFELVDVVPSRLSSFHSKQPSSVGVIRSLNSPVVVQSPALSNSKSDHLIEFNAAAQCRKGNLQESRNDLDESVLNRLFHIDPLKQKSVDKTCHLLMPNSANNEQSPSELRGTEIVSLGEKFEKFDHNVGKQLSKLRDDFHAMQLSREQNDRQTNNRLDTLENRMVELNVQLSKFNTHNKQTETLRSEQKIQVLSNPKSDQLIDFSAEKLSPLKKVVRPKPIRPVSNGKFQIKWEEEEETEEEEIVDLTSDSALTSSTASSTMSPTYNTSEDEGPSYRQCHKGNLQKSRNDLDKSILNRLLHIDPLKQKSVDNTCNLFLPNCPINEHQPSKFRGTEIVSLGEKFEKFDHNVGKQLSKLRDDFHAMQLSREQNDRQTNNRLDTLENRMVELNVQLSKFNTLNNQTETLRSEQEIQVTNLMRENGRVCEEFGEHQNGLKVVQSRIDLLEQWHLREFFARLPPVFEDGSLVLSQFEMGNYCAEMKMLFQSGSNFCSGLAIKGSAHFRNYPSDLFNQLIEHALTTHQVQKMLRWAVFNFPTNEKCPWPQVLLLSGNCVTNESNGPPNECSNNNSMLYIYRNSIRKRAVLSDRVVYSLLNQHSSHKFVLNIYYTSEAEKFNQMHCFTIRRHRPSR